MHCFLKEILELSEQDVFDHLTSMETSMERPSISTSINLHTEVVLPSPNVGLPRHLMQIQRPEPAYVTHTGALVRTFTEQEEQREASPNPSAQTEPSAEPRGAGWEEETPAPSRGSSTARGGEDSVGMPVARSTFPSRNVYNRVIFARKPALRVLPRSSLVCSSGKE